MKISFWIILILIATSLLSSCGPEISVSATATPISSIQTPILIKPQSANFPTETPSALGQYMIPAYYPDSYITTVDGSRDEGKLTIYSNMSNYNWNSVIRSFNSHYPWILVTTLDLGPSESFKQYNNEVAENKPTADMIVSSDAVNWLQFFEKRSVLKYPSQEDIYVPDMAKSVYGTYTVSSEPIIIIYNKKLVSVPPKNMSDLAEMVKNDPEGFKGQIVTSDAELDASAFAINWFWTDNTGTPGWDILNAIGEAQLVLLASNSMVVESVGKGGAKIGYFVPANEVMPHIKAYPDLGWVFMPDAQPVFLNSMAITEKAANPNSAKLMMDFILSQEGQYALALGGLTPYRSDISSITEYHLDKIFTELGDSNVLLYSFDTRLNNQALMDSFLEKWRTAVHKQSIPEPTK